MLFPDMNLKTGNTSHSPLRSPDFRRIIRKSCHIISKQGGGIRKLLSG